MCAETGLRLWAQLALCVFMWHTSLQRFVKYRLRGCGEAVGFLVCFLGVEFFIYLFICLCHRCDYLRIYATLGDGEGKGLQERVRARCETARVSRGERWSRCFQTVGASFWRSFGAEPGCGAACGMPSTRRLTALHSLHPKGWAGARGRCLSNDVLGEKKKKL